MHPLNAEKLSRDARDAETEDTACAGKKPSE